MLFRPFFVVLLILWTHALTAHEFWIDPLEYQVQPGDKIQAHFRVGSDYEGSKYGFLTQRTTTHGFAFKGKFFTASARNGDIPALQLQGAIEGLISLVHETKDNQLTYADWNKFLAFTKHKDFDWAVDQHKARGLPETGFVETYRRHAKSLIGVGAGAGQDMRVGMRLELVALANPYTDDLTDGMPVQVWFQNKPIVDGQVELYERAPDGTVTVTLHRTDAKGVAALPVKAGHIYMADHVVMIPLENETLKDPAWHSAWGNLTFKVPE